MVTVISGTNRKGSMTLQVALLCEKILRDMGQEVKLLDLCDLPHDFVFTALYGNKNPEFENILQENIYSASKLVVLSPEYNGGFSGVLKAFIDGWNPKMLKGQKVAMVGVASGRSGNLRGLDYMTNVFHYMKLHVYPDKVPVSSVHTLGNAEGVHDEATKAVLERMLSGFVGY
ncbi:MAG: NAD(P)H-dependent oxidoreductase [Bacteroidetes bacterium]|nr:NAD(P)H-dependent oxidoreductase [Bacteroidota bacterium]